MGRKGIRSKMVKGARKKRTHSFRRKSGKHRSALSGKPLHGVPHGRRTGQVRKLSKTEKRPTGMFGTALSAQERMSVWEEAAKVQLGIKPLEEVAPREKNMVEKALYFLNKKK